MNIAIIGVRDLVEIYALNYALAGHEVFMAFKDKYSRTMPSVLENYENIRVCSIEEAGEAADMIIVAAYPKDVREIAYWLGDVRRKVIIDATANIQAPDDETANTIGAMRAITGSANVIKVFSTRGYEQLLKPLLGGDKTQLLLAGDSKKAKEITKILTIELGVNRFVDLGGDEAIPLFDELTKGWRNLSMKQAGQNKGVSAIKN